MEISVKMTLMKKFILSSVCLLIFSMFSCAFADETSISNSNCNMRPKQQTNTAYGESEEQVWNNEEEQNTEENYGSDKSPYFINRNNTVPDDTDDCIDPYSYGE